MRTFKELLSGVGFTIGQQSTVAGEIPRLKWVVDDRGRVAALNSHPVALWASAFDPPIKAILDLGFICIEDRSRSLIIGLNTPRVKRVTLAGAFYFLAQQDAKPIIIYSDCNTEFAYYTVVFDANAIYRLLEEMVTSQSANIPSIAISLKSKTGKRNIRQIRPRLPVARLSRSTIGAEEQSVHL